MHDPDTHQTLTSHYVGILSYHPVTIRQNQEHSAQFCLGESPEYKCFDLCYSFKTLVCVGYGGVRQLHDAAWNYQNNQAKDFSNRDDAQMSYGKALRNSIGFMCLNPCPRMLHCDG